jgi:hypothetical protein
MKTEKQLSHDILNLIERLRIMHDIVKDKKFNQISEEEFFQDLDETLKDLKTHFEQLAQ